MTTDPIVCRDVVELVSDYLDFELTWAVHVAVAAHVRDCVGCATFVVQVRTTVGALGTLSPPWLDRTLRDRPEAEFRTWPAARDGNTGAG